MEGSFTAANVEQQLWKYAEVAKLYLNDARVKVNDCCSDQEPWQLIAMSVGITIILAWLYNWMRHPLLTIPERIKMSFFKTFRSLPFVKQVVKKEMEKSKAAVTRSLNCMKDGEVYLKALPMKGMSESAVLRRIKNGYHAMDEIDWKKGRVSGCVYGGTDELSSLCAKVYKDFAWSNPLHPDVFPSVRRMEGEVVAMCLSMFSGGPDSCGAMTSGGTESILMACLACRERARERGIEFPEILAPVSVHAAFDKAAHYFRMRLVHIPLDKKTHAVKVKAMKRAISSRTCMLVGSAPSFPTGVFDDIEAIAKLGEKYDIPVHVDACLGGFLIPFMDKAGFPVPPFDFRLKGVTSISADTHKYGFAPKGSSVVLYSNMEMRRRQFFVAPDWPGGIYASPSIAGSRPGAIIAACWATMVNIGEAGYIESTRQIIRTTRYMLTELKKIKGIYVLGEPLVSVIALGSNDFDIYRLFGDLTKRGWSLNNLQFPPSFHMCVTLRHTFPGVADGFVRDVRDVTAALLSDPTAKCQGSAAVYGTSQSIPDRSLVADVARSFWDVCYSTEDIKTVSNGIQA
ncbi:sphingosine-1-phosphate lyase 1-like [Acanthaster planci]|uniref:sphinganine-1-phosphate aldolase n=1 Tax=Acanthaster planci TaxID=133434 RepID=A0A8B8A5B2_ACAPL|nr:sphingosine-1-phosphate lyase 1-like [Acanthaster planci]